MDANTTGKLIETGSKFAGDLVRMAIAHSGKKRTESVASSEYPLQNEALKKLGSHTVVTLHDDGDVTVKSQGKLYVVTTGGTTFEQVGQREAAPVATSAWILEKAPKAPSQDPTLTRVLAASTKDTIDDNNRDIGKWIDAMEEHCVQKFRKRGKPCDCGQFRHIPRIEGLCEETIEMVDNHDIYYRIIALGKELDPKVTLEAIASEKYDDEFPKYAARYRSLRKELLGSLKPEAMFPHIIFPRIAPEANQEPTADSENEEGEAQKIWPNGTVCEHLLPMVEWVQGEECRKGHMRDCNLALTIAWYYEELQERGLTELVDDFEKIQKEGDPVKVAAALDQIKEQVEPEVKQRLLEFDCATQSFDPDEFADEVQPGDSPVSSQPHAHSSDTE